MRCGGEGRGGKLPPPPPMDISLPRQTRGWGKEELSRSMAIDHRRNDRSGEEIVIDQGGSIVNRSGRSIAIDRDQSGRSIGEIVIDRIENFFF